jgi:glycosyltransferase involved in cell wall biosynthesis
MTRLLGTGLAKRGHEVTVIGLYPRASDSWSEEEDVRVIRLAAASLPRTGFVLNGIYLRRALSRLHAEHPIDVLEGPEAGLALVGKRTSYKKIIRMNGGHRFFAVTLGKRPAPWRSYLEKRSFDRADALCAVSHYVAEETRRLLDLGEAPIEILPNPVDTQWFSTRNRAEIAGRIMFFGTFVEKKGLRQLVQALPRIIGQVPEAHLVAVGRDTFDRKGQRFTDLVLNEIDPQWIPKVSFTDQVPHHLLPDLLQESAVISCPSHMEAFGMVWAEAMAVGRAVIGSRTGPGPEVIADGETGLLCDPHNPSDIATTAIRLLTDEQLRSKLGAAGRKRAETEFSLETLLPRNEAFYQRVTG